MLVIINSKVKTTLLLFFSLGFLSSCSPMDSNFSADVNSNNFGFIIENYDIKNTEHDVKKTMQNYDKKSYVGENVSPVDALVKVVRGVLPSDSDSNTIEVDHSTESNIPSNLNKTTSNLGKTNVKNYEKVRNLGKFKITAYCPCAECSGGYGRSTSLGVRAKSNHTVAADRSILPLGTEIIIGDTVYRVEDTGGAVKGKVIDIFFDTHSEVVEFGRQYKDVYIAKKK